METLPIELVSSIFLMGCERLGKTALLRHRLSISAVCSSWRAIALSTQPLWSLIHVYPTSNSSTPSALSLLRMHLERAHNVSLDVMLFPMAAHISDTNLASLWDAISKHLPRCQSLGIFGDIYPNIILPFRVPMERLERLDVSIFSSVRLLAVFLFTP